MPSITELNVTRRQFLQGMRNLILPEYEVGQAIHHGKNVLNDLTALSVTTKIGLGIQASLFLPSCSVQKPETAKSHTTQDILHSLQNNPNLTADNSAYNVLAFGSTIALTQSEFAALNLGQNVLPILEAGKVIAIALPTTLVVSGLLINPMLPADVIEPPRIPIYNEAGKIIRFQEMTPQQAFFIRTGKVVRVVEVQDLSQIHRTIDLNFAQTEADNHNAKVKELEANGYDSSVLNIPDGWKPPDKDYCGQKLDKYFALLLMDETIANLMVDKLNLIKDYDFDSKITQDFKEKYQPLLNRIENKLKDEKCFFYDNKNPVLKEKGSGSVYEDFKHFRVLRFPKIGEKHSWERANFNLDMSVDKMYEQCLKEVQSWWNLPLPK